jgi:hypothetical protein
MVNFLQAFSAFFAHTPLKKQTHNSPFCQPRKKAATHADREICALFVEINCKLARKTVKKAAGLSNAA